MSTIGSTPGVPVNPDLFLMKSLFLGPLSQAGVGFQLGRLMLVMAENGMNPVPPERAHLADRYLKPITKIMPHAPAPRSRENSVRDIAEAKLYLKAREICDILGGGWEGSYLPGKLSRKVLVKMKELARGLDPKRHRMALAYVLGRMGDLESSPVYHRRAAELWLPKTRDGKSRGGGVEFKSVEGRPLSVAEREFVRQSGRMCDAYAKMDAEAVLAIIQNAAFDVWRTQDRKFIYLQLEISARDLFWHNFPVWHDMSRSRRKKTADQSSRLATAGFGFVTSANLFVASAVVAFGLGRFEDSTLAGASLSWRFARDVFGRLLKDKSLCGFERESLGDAVEAIAVVLEEFDRLRPQPNPSAG